MAFVEKKPTEEEIKYLKSFEIRCPYGNSGSFDEIYYDKDRNFYMFYLFGPGFKRESLPMYWGIVWNDKPIILGVYKSSTGRPSEGLHVVWDICSIVGKNNEFIEINDEIVNVIKDALISTNGCTHFKVIDTKFI